MTFGGGVPNDNPFDDLVWAYGIRNSFGFAFDPRSDEMWETENGPECNDEVNRIVEGDNYGWGPNETCSGTSPGNTNQDGPNPILPELFYENTIGITGIAFCDGCGLGRRSEGAAFAGAVNNGDVTRILFNDQRNAIASQSVVYHHGDSTLSYEVGPGGRIYFSDFDGINKLVRN
jgi:glucose/arabinose dehydrogenase